MWLGSAEVSTLMMLAADMADKKGSLVPQRDGAHLDAYARRAVSWAQRIVEGHMRHAMRVPPITVMGLENYGLAPIHVGEPVPAMRGAVCHDQPFEGPLRLAGRVEHRIGGDQLFTVDAARITQGQC